MMNQHILVTNHISTKPGDDKEIDERSDRPLVVTALLPHARARAGRTEITEVGIGARTIIFAWPRSEIAGGCCRGHFKGVAACSENRAGSRRRSADFHGVVNGPAGHGSVLKKSAYRERARVDFEPSASGVAPQRIILGFPKPHPLTEPIAILLEALVPIDHFYHQLEAKLELRACDELGRLGGWKMKLRPASPTQPR